MFPVNFKRAGQFKLLNCFFTQLSYPSRFKVSCFLHQGHMAHCSCNKEETRSSDALKMFLVVEREENAYHQIQQQQQQQQKQKLRWFLLLIHPLKNIVNVPM